MLPRCRSSSSRSRAFSSAVRRSAFLAASSSLRAQRSRALSSGSSDGVVVGVADGGGVTLAWAWWPTGLGEVLTSAAVSADVDESDVQSEFDGSADGTRVRVLDGMAAPAGASLASSSSSDGRSCFGHRNAGDVASWVGGAADGTTGFCSPPAMRAASVHCSCPEDADGREGRVADGTAALPTVTNVAEGAETDSGSMVASWVFAGGVGAVIDGSTDGTTAHVADDVVAVRREWRRCRGVEFCGWCMALCSHGAPEETADEAEGSSGVAEGRPSLHGASACAKRQLRNLQPFGERKCRHGRIFLTDCSGIADGTSDGWSSFAFCSSLPALQQAPLACPASFPVCGAALSPPVTQTGFSSPSQQEPGYTPCWPSGFSTLLLSVPCATLRAGSATAIVQWERPVAGLHAGLVCLGVAWEPDEPVCNMPTRDARNWMLIT